MTWRSVRLRLGSQATTRRAALPLAALLLTSVLRCQPAPRAAIVDTVHGVEVADPFRGLEDIASAATSSWVKAMDRQARAFSAAAPGRDATQRSILRAAAAPLVGVPISRGPFAFLVSRSASGPGTVTAVSVRAAGAKGIGRVIARPTTGKSIALLGVSPDGQWALVAESATGSNWSSAFLIAVRSGLRAPMPISGIHRLQSSVIWTADSRGFFYIRTEQQGDPKAPTPGASHVRYRSRDGGTDEPVPLADDDAQGLLTLAGSSGGRPLVVMRTAPASAVTSIHVVDAAEPKARGRLIRRQRATYAFAGERSGSLFFAEWSAGSNGSIVALDRAFTDTAWRTIVPAGDAVISNWPGTSAIVVSDGLLIGYVGSEGGLTPKYVGFDGTLRRSIALPTRGSVWSGFVSGPDSVSVRYQLSGLVDPGSTYVLNVRTGQSRREWRAAVGFDPSDFVTERRDVLARDGATIPVDIVRHRETRLDGTAPLILYGYGFGGWNAAPWYQPMMAAWLRDGGVWAVAGLRGDGVRGEAWHNAGTRERKGVGVQDYLDVAKAMVDAGVTRTDRLVANASSAGGSLVGAAVLRRPERFGAAVFDYAIFDMVRYERFGHAAQWVGEFGSVSDAAEFTALHANSPVHQVPGGQCLPPIMLAPGERDETVTPVHSYKFAAALLDRPSRCRAPVVLRTTWGAGHNAGASLHDAVATWTDELAFLRRVLPSNRRN